MGPRAPCTPGGTRGLGRAQDPGLGSASGSALRGSGGRGPCARTLLLPPRPRAGPPVPGACWGAQPPCTHTPPPKLQGHRPRGRGATLRLRAEAPALLGTRARPRSGASGRREVRARPRSHAIYCAEILFSSPNGAFPAVPAGGAVAEGVGCAGVRSPGFRLRALGFRQGGARRHPAGPAPGDKGCCLIILYGPCPRGGTHGALLKVPTDRGSFRGRHLS